MKNFEKHEHTEDAPVQNEAPVDFTPSPETGEKMKSGLNKQKEVQKRETAENFCERLDGFMTEYSSYKVKVGGDEYTLKLQHIEREGDRVEKSGYEALKNDLRKNPESLDGVGGVFVMEGGGIKVEYSLPAKLMIDPDGIPGRLYNDLSGGTADYYKQRGYLPPAPEKEEKTKDAEAQENALAQAKEAAAAARAQGGEPGILSGEGLITLIINFPQGKQMRISSTTGAVWNCEEVDNGNRVQRVQKGTRATPLEFLVPSEGDPGA